MNLSLLPLAMSQLKQSRLNSLASPREEKLNYKLWKSNRKSLHHILRIYGNSEILKESIENHDHMFWKNMTLKKNENRSKKSLGHANPN